MHLQLHSIPLNKNSIMCEINFENNMEECMLISKACAYSQGALVLEVLVQDGPSALLDKGAFI